MNDGLNVTHTEYISVRGVAPKRRKKKKHKKWKCFFFAAVMVMVITIHIHILQKLKPICTTSIFSKNIFTCWLASLFDSLQLDSFFSIFFFSFGSEIIIYWISQSKSFTRIPLWFSWALNTIVRVCVCVSHFKIFRIVFTLEWLFGYICTKF